MVPQAAAGVKVMLRILFITARHDRLTCPRDCPYTDAAMTGRSTITAIMTTTMRKHGGRAVVSLTLDMN